MKDNFHKNNLGFTLIELLVVIAIIGILSSVVLASLNTAREKSRDARRLSDMKQITLALELYYDENGDYPNITHGLGYDTGCTTTPGCGHCNRWCTLATKLKLYIDPLPREQLGDTSSVYYSFSSVSGNNYQSYGLSAVLETNLIAQNDGGFYSSMIETGDRVFYCVNKYSGSDRDWLNTGSPWSNVCEGGN